MQASRDEISTMLQMQQLDLEVMRAKKQLEELPQRTVIVEAREKKRTIEAKRDQVEQMRLQMEEKIFSIEEEDERLVAKQKEVQAAIDQAQGDYRNIESRTKELNGVAKRRATLESNLEEAGTQLEKIESVRSQILAALAAVEAEEAQAIASFQEIGGALQDDIAKKGALRNKIAESLSDELAHLYTKTSARCGGVAIGSLAESRCGVCRADIPSERLIEIHREAPLSTCPACRRLLVVL